MDRLCLEKHTSFLFTALAVPIGCFADDPTDEDGGSVGAGSSSSSTASTSTSTDASASGSADTEVDTGPGTSTAPDASASDDGATRTTGFTSFDATGEPEPTVCERAGEHVTDCIGAVYGQTIQSYCETAFLYAEQLGPTCEDLVSELFACLANVPCLALIDGTGCAEEREAFEIECSDANTTGTDTSG